MEKVSLDKVINQYIELADNIGHGVPFAVEVAEGLLELKRRREEDAQRLEQIPIDIPTAKASLISSIDDIIAEHGENLKNDETEFNEKVYSEVAQVLVDVQSLVGDVFDRLILVK